MCHAGCSLRGIQPATFQSRLISGVRPIENNVMRNYLTLTISLLAAGCAADHPKHQLNKNEGALVGSWISTKFTFTQHYTIRRPDKTFTEYRFNAIEGDRKAATYTLKGTWEIKNHKYNLKYINANDEGKPDSLEIYKHTPDLFEYVSYDGCPISERRATEAELQILSEDPFGFITEEGKRNYTIESR
jgi:hypothetical protein